MNTLIGFLAPISNNASKQASNGTTVSRFATLTAATAVFAGVDFLGTIVERCGIPSPVHLNAAVDSMRQPMGCLGDAREPRLAHSLLGESSHARVCCVESVWALSNGVRVRTSESRAHP